MARRLLRFAGMRLLRWIFITSVLIAAGCRVHSPEPAPRLARPSAPAPGVADDSIGITWVGHATVLVRIHDRWFMTDPVLSKRIAKIYPRNVEAAIDLSAMPTLDAVLVSHAHFDHLDVPSLRALRAHSNRTIVPSGAAKFLPDEVVQRGVTGLATWQTWTRNGVTITAVPASHGHGRYLVDRWNDDTATGFVIQYRGRTVYFAGDTGYVPAHAAELRKRFSIDVALLPIGPAGRAKWIERWRADVHTTPEHAMQLFVASGAQWMVPIHYDTFFKPRGYERPFLDRAIANAALEHRVRVLDIGDSTDFVY